MGRKPREKSGTGIYHVMLEESTGRIFSKMKRIMQFSRNNFIVSYSIRMRVESPNLLDV